MVILEVEGDFLKELVGKIAIFEEIGAVFEVDNVDLGVDGGGFGLFGEFDQGMTGFGEVKIDDIWSGSAVDAGDFVLSGDKTGKPNGRITGVVFLIIGAFVSLVDDNQTQVAERGEEGGARPDDDLRGKGYS